MDAGLSAVVSAAVEEGNEKFLKKLLSGEWVPVPEYLSPKQTSVYIGVAVTTLEGWRSAGEGPRFSKIGHLVRYRRADLDAWFAAHVVQPKGGA